MSSFFILPLVRKKREILVPVDLDFFSFFFVQILRRMGKNKAYAPTRPRIRYMPCFDLTHAPVATAARAAATGLVSKSTRPDPEGSGTVEIATRRCPRLWVVWDLRELDLDVVVFTRKILRRSSRALEICDGAFFFSQSRQIDGNTGKT